MPRAPQITRDYIPHIYEGRDSLKRIVEFVSDLHDMMEERAMEEYTTYVKHYKDDFLSALRMLDLYLTGKDEKWMANKSEYEKRYERLAGDLRWDIPLSDGESVLVLDPDETGGVSLASGGKQALHQWEAMTGRRQLASVDPPLLKRKGYVMTAPNKIKYRGATYVKAALTDLDVLQKQISDMWTASIELQKIPTDTISKAAAEIQGIVESFIRQTTPPLPTLADLEEDLREPMKELQKLQKELKSLEAAHRVFRMETTMPQRARASAPKKVKYRGALYVEADVPIPMDIVKRQREDMPPIADAFNKAYSRMRTIEEDLKGMIKALQPLGDKLKDWELAKSIQNGSTEAIRLAEDIIFRIRKVMGLLYETDLEGGVMEKYRFLNEAFNEAAEIMKGKRNESADTIEIQREDIMEEIDPELSERETKKITVPQPLRAQYIRVDGHLYKRRRG